MTVRICTHACVRRGCVCSWMCTYVCARACHMYACNCNVSVCHVFDCSSVFFFHCKCKKKLAHDFLIFSLPDTHTGRLSGHKTKYKTNVLTFIVMTDNRCGIMVCSSVFQGTQSASLDIWTRSPLDNFFFGQDDLLSLSLSLSLRPRLSVCLSVCLSLSLSLSHSLTQTLSQSLSLSLTCPWFSLQEMTSVCMFSKTLVRTAIPEQ